MIQNGECGAFSEKILSSFAGCREDMFRHALNSGSQYGSSMPAGIATASLSWTKILFVDDNEINREMGEEILQSEGAEVVTAASGEEAIRIFRDSEVGYFDAILMDVIMPEWTVWKQPKRLETSRARMRLLCR
jgi:FOG: CheY-like receiver